MLDYLWSHSLYDRFADRWNANGVARYYDGNIVLSIENYTFNRMFNHKFYDL